MNKPLLAVEDLHIEFHDHSRPETVVYDFELTMEPGEIVGLVGESGSGKSMSAMAIAGLLARHEIHKRGQIRFGDIDIMTCSREELRGIQGDEVAIIFQEPQTSLNPVLRIGPQVEESARIHHPELSDAKLKEMAIYELGRVGLEDPEKVYSQYPHELSGGMRQRAMIAAAMISKPRLLIADEPTTALDVIVQAQIIDLLLEINRQEHTAILFISHDLSLVRQFCHRVLVMQNGRIVEEGITNEVFVSPQETYTKRLVGAIPVVDLTQKSDRPVRPLSKEDPILTLTDLKVSYPLPRKLFHPQAMREVVHGVTYTMPRGCITGLVGESGSGKSTLAKAILGLAEITGGSFTCKEPRPQMIFQDPYHALNPAHRVGWLLEEPLRVATDLTDAQRNARVEEMMERVRLDLSLKDRYPSQLSGGQRQRVCIAQALMLSPKLLIADEPVSALDVTIQVEILGLLRRLRDELELSILFISHDLRTVYQLCDEVLIMKDGELIERGPVRQIYQHPQATYTKQLLSAANITAKERDEE